MAGSGDLALHRSARARLVQPIEAIWMTLSTYLHMRRSWVTMIPARPSSWIRSAKMPTTWLARSVSRLADPSWGWRNIRVQESAVQGDLNSVSDEPIDRAPPQRLECTHRYGFPAVDATGCWTARRDVGTM